MSSWYLGDNLHRGVYMYELVLLVIFINALLMAGAWGIGMNYAKKVVAPLWCLKPFPIIAISLSYALGGWTASHFFSGYFASQALTPEMAKTALLLAMTAPALIGVSITMFGYNLGSSSQNTRDITACVAGYLVSHGTWVLTSAQQLGVPFDAALGCISAFPVFWAAIVGIAAVHQTGQRSQRARILTHPGWDRDASA